jgi:hypothetical protein
MSSVKSYGGLHSVLSRILKDSSINRATMAETIVRLSALSEKVSSA